MHIAMLGTRGVPALYGGFETAVEEIGSRLVKRGHTVTVYCRNPGQKLSEYRGMRLVNLPAVRRRSLETPSHTALSISHCVIQRPDAAVLFNAGNAPFLPLLKAITVPTAVHMDGLEWKRAKWAGTGQRYYRWAESYSAKHGFALIADARGIAEYLHKKYGRGSYFIPYGAPITRPSSDRLPSAGLSPYGYHLVVARLEPENNVHVILNGHLESGSSTPLVVVGSVPYDSAYHKRLLRTAAHSNVLFFGGIWDQAFLDQLYAYARSYLHGHSVGGTNPSLLRAMGAGAPITAFDVPFNREVAKEHARYFIDSTDVASALLMDDAEPDYARVRGERGRSHVSNRYRWDDVVDEYERMLFDVMKFHATRS